MITIKSLRNMLWSILIVGLLTLSLSYVYESRRVPADELLRNVDLIVDKDFREYTENLRFGHVEEAPRCHDDDCDPNYFLVLNAALPEINPCPANYRLRGHAKKDNSMVWGCYR